MTVSLGSCNGEGWLPYLHCWSQQQRLLEREHDHAHEPDEQHCQQAQQHLDLHLHQQPPHAQQREADHPLLLVLPHLALLLLQRLWLGSREGTTPAAVRNSAHASASGIHLRQRC